MRFDTQAFLSLCTETAGEMEIDPFTIVSKVARLRGFFFPVDFLPCLYSDGQLVTNHTFLT